VPNELELKLFEISVNTALNNLRIMDKAKIVGVESTISAFVDRKGQARVIYLAQIGYEQK